MKYIIYNLKKINPIKTNLRSPMKRFYTYSILILKKNNPGSDFEA